MMGDVIEHLDGRLLHDRKEDRACGCSIPDVMGRLPIGFCEAPDCEGRALRDLRYGGRSDRRRRLSLVHLP